MNSVEELLELCNLEQRLLVERVLKFTEDREAEFREREAELKDQSARLQYLTKMFFEDHIRRHFDENEWTRWRDRHLEQYELRKRDEGTRR